MSTKPAPRPSLQLEGHDWIDLERICERYHGAQGRLAYRAARWVNDELFAGGLVVPLIQWALTPYGACIGLTQSRMEEAPVITLHPTIWSQGPRMVFDVIVHEMTHAAVFYVHGGHSGHSSHDNPVWCGELMRISPLIGLPGVIASPTKRFREDGRLKRGTPSGASMGEISRWPHAFRSADYFQKSEVPFQW